MNIPYINLKNINVSDLIQKLNRLGIQENYLSDISFCPYLIVHFDFKDNKTITYENINEGFFKNLKTKENLIESSDIDSLIYNIHYKMKEKNNNSLF